MEVTDARFGNIEATLSCHEISIKNIEHHIGEILDTLSKEKEEFEQARQVSSTHDKAMNHIDEVGQIECIASEIVRIDEEHHFQNLDWLNEDCVYVQRNLQGDLLTSCSFEAENTQEEASPKVMEQTPFFRIDQLIECKKEILGREEDVGRIFKPSNDPPVLSLDNSQPKLFPWRPKVRWLGSPTKIPPRQVDVWFKGSSYAMSSREEHTLFKPP